MKKISLIVPCYNEASNIETFYNSFVNTFHSIENQYIYEIIFIDDGSEDETLDKMISLAKNDHNIKIIELSRNFGKEAALTAGLDVSSGDAIIPIDADLQDPVELILEMISVWNSGAEIVLAKRINRSEDSWLKRVTASFFYKIHNSISDIKIPNNVGDFRLMDRSVVNAIKSLPEQQRFMKGLFSWVGFKTASIEYSRLARNAGSTKFSGWKLWNFAIEGITSFSSLPLRIWTYIGFLGAISSLLYAFIIIFKTIIFGIDVPGYASLIVLLLFFGSLQLIGIGVLGEYISRIYMESKKRPIYIIRNKHEFK